MKIAFIHTGATHLTGFRLPFLKFLVEKGHTVFALAPDFEKEHKEVLKKNGIRSVDYTINRTSMNPIKDLQAAAGLKKILASLNIDTVITNTAKSVIYGTLAAKLAKVPKRHALVSGLGYPFTDLGHFFFNQFTARNATRLLYTFAFRLNSTTTFQNPDDLAEMVSKKVCPKKKGYNVLGSGVELATHPQAEKLPTNPPTFIMISRILATKGVFEYLQAAKRIKQKNPEMRFLLVGGIDQNPGSLTEEETEKIIQESGVEWTGQVPDVKPWLQQSTVFVLPSYYREGVPHSGLQAMATGLPVITTDTPGCREMVCNEKNGYLVPVRDAEMLADAMQKITTNPESLKAMGQASRRIAETSFNVKLINQQMSEIMRL